MTLVLWSEHRCGTFEPWPDLSILICLLRKSSIFPGEFAFSITYVNFKVLIYWARERAGGPCWLISHGMHSQGDWSYNGFGHTQYNDHNNYFLLLLVLFVALLLHCADCWLHCWQINDRLIMDVPMIIWFIRPVPVTVTWVSPGRPPVLEHNKSKLWRFEVNVFENANSPEKMLVIFVVVIKWSWSLLKLIHQNW